MNKTLRNVSLVTQKIIDFLTKWINVSAKMVTTNKMSHVISVIKTVKLVTWRLPIL